MIEYPSQQLNAKSLLLQKTQHYGEYISF